MHPKIEAISFLSDEKIWKKMIDERWRGTWRLASKEYVMDTLEKHPQYTFRVSTHTQNFTIEYYDGNFCIISYNNIEYALLWNPKLVE